MPAGHPHAVYAAERCKMLLNVFFKKNCGGKTAFLSTTTPLSPLRSIFIRKGFNPLELSRLRMKRSSGSFFCVTNCLQNKLALTS